MRFHAVIATSASFLALASARIIGAAVPSEVKPGDSFDAILLTQNYIQTVADIAVAYGIITPPGYPDTLGREIASAYLGPTKSNIVTNITEKVTLPADVAEGDYLWNVAVFSLYGASSSPTISNYSVPFTVGSTTSDVYVSSNQQ